MKTIILVMGLSGSGKTTFSLDMLPILGDHLYLNADVVRRECEDWDFSEEGRMRQAKRMAKLAEESDKPVVVIDMICPLKKMRDIIKPDMIFFMDRVKTSKYADTDAIFEIPTEKECDKLYILHLKE